VVSTGSTDQEFHNRQTDLWWFRQAQPTSGGGFDGRAAYGGAAQPTRGSTTDQGSDPDRRDPWWFRQAQPTRSSTTDRRISGGFDRLNRPGEVESTDG